MSKNTELTIFDQYKPLQIFQENKGDDFLKGIEKECEEFKKNVDISTTEGRNKVKSFAAKIARTKAPLDKAGLELTEDMRGKISLINAERTRIKEKLQNLQDDVRRPLTEFEEKEKKRIETFQDKIKDIESLREQPCENLEFVNELLHQVKRIHGAVKDWQEFKMKADIEFEKTKKFLIDAMEVIAKREEQQAELEKLRKEKAEREQREQKEREEEIIRETEENIRRVEREKVAKEAEDARYKLEAEKKQAEQAKINAEIRVKEGAKIARAEKEQAKIRAEQDKEEAIKTERLRIEAERQKEIEAEKAREADIKHRTKINNEAANAIAKYTINLDEEDEEADNIEALKIAKRVLIAIAKGKITHISIKY